MKETIIGILKNGKFWMGFMSFVFGAIGYEASEEQKEDISNAISLLFLTLMALPWDKWRKKDKDPVVST